MHIFHRYEVVHSPLAFWAFLQRCTKCDKERVRELI